MRVETIDKLNGLDLKVLSTDGVDIEEWLTIRELLPEMTDAAVMETIHNNCLSIISEENRNPKSIFIDPCGMYFLMVRFLKNRAFGYMEKSKLELSKITAHSLINQSKEE